MRQNLRGSLRASIAFGIGVLLFGGSGALAQTTAGIGTTIAFPLIAQTGSFASEVTLFNPGASLLSASVAFYEANNSAQPGAKVCNDVSVPAGRSVQFALATQCALGAGGHFGLVVVADKAQPAGGGFYGYMRVQNPQGIGFSVEGFPGQNFNNQPSHAIGLKRQAGAPTYQTNCFVGSLEQPVGYELKLFNGSSGAQIGGTLSGSLQAFQQFRYLDVFGPNGVNAPAGNQLNVRAEFKQTSGGSANLIGFCTVQDNTSFGADFRIAKSFGSPASNFFVQGGNAFGTTATLGTTDNQPLNINVNNQRVMRYEPNATSPNLLGGHPNNSVSASVGQTIAGGGQAGSTCFDPQTFLDNGPCTNRATGHYATVGGGFANLAANRATVAGGESNVANGFGATVAGGYASLANDFYATVGGGFGNKATNEDSTVAGGDQNSASGQWSTVSGGVFNMATNSRATVAGGQTNHATGPISTVSGGISNVASGELATVGGGQQNTASGLRATVAGGFVNTASGQHAMIVGGQANAAGPWSFAAGFHANAQNTGCFVWADSTSANPASCFGNNEFIARALGGFYFFTGGFSDATYSGAQLPAGAGSWSVYSDRAGKENLVGVETIDVLEKLVSIPIATWNWKAQGGGIRHIGPMAQDFHAAFGMGESDKTISTVDADGVALAAIQGLHRLVQEKDARIEQQQRTLDAQQVRLAALSDRVGEVETLRAEVAALRQAVARLAAQPALTAASTGPR